MSASDIPLSVTLTSFFFFALFSVSSTALASPLSPGAPLVR